VSSTTAKVMTKIPMLDLKAQYGSIAQEVRAAIDSVLESQHFIQGSNVEALEEEIARYCGSRFAVGVASGTDALLLALHAVGVGPGDEVIVPSFSFIATADTVSLLGAVPVFVDVQSDTFNIDPALIEGKVTSRTRAIIAVHLYGQPADMDPILRIGREKQLPILEDSAQAIGARYKGRRVTSLGEAGCLSFFPSKNLGGYGDGGMIVTNSEELARRLRSLRSHGSTKKYFSAEQGWNSRLDELQAAILRVKLRHLDIWNAARRANADLYDSLLGSIPGVIPPARAPFAEHTFHQYTIRVPNRERVQIELAAGGIASAVYYPVPIHLQPIYSSLAYRSGDLPETERASEEVLSLPMYPELSRDQIHAIALAIRSALHV
jgi:UDP-N-acetyl-3-dehydro-alpha-D-glucosamine 3-aminotranferase